MKNKLVCHPLPFQLVSCEKFSLLLQPIIYTQTLIKNANMEQSQFLEKNIFTDLKNLNDGFAEGWIQYFSESRFWDCFRSS